MAIGLHNIGIGGGKAGNAITARSQTTETFEMACGRQIEMRREHSRTIETNHKETRQ